MIDKKPVWTPAPLPREGGEREFVFTAADFERVR